MHGIIRASCVCVSIRTADAYVMVRTANRTFCTHHHLKCSDNRQRSLKQDLSWCWSWSHWPNQFLSHSRSLTDTAFWNVEVQQKKTVSKGNLRDRVNVKCCSDLFPCEMYRSIPNGDAQQPNDMLSVESLFMKNVLNSSKSKQFSVATSSTSASCRWRWRVEGNEEVARGGGMEKRWWRKIWTTTFRWA